MTNEKNPAAEGHEPSDGTQHLPTDDTVHLPTEGAAGRPTDNTEHLPALDPTTEIPAASGDPVGDGTLGTVAAAESESASEPAESEFASEQSEGQPDWAHAERTESELRADAAEAAAASAAASATPVIPAVPVGATGAAAAGAVGGGGLPPRSGFWQRTGDAWRRVWSRTWGKVAVIAIAGLAVLALVSAIGLAVFAGGRDRDHGRMAGGRDGSIACAQGQQRDQGQGGRHGNRQGKGRSGDDCASDNRGQGANGGGRSNRGGDQGRGPGSGPDADADADADQGDQPTMPNGRGIPGKGMGNGTGRGGLGNGGGLGGQSLAGALHGELTLGGVSPRTVLFQVGEITEFTAGQSLALKSTDGFTATYALTPDTTGPATGVEVGATVRVIADKDGAKATRIVLLDAPATT